MIWVIIPEVQPNLVVLLESTVLTIVAKAKVVAVSLSATLLTVGAMRSGTV